MRIYDAIRKKKPLMIGIAGAIIVGLLLPVLQTGFFQNSFSAWFLTLMKSPLNTGLYIVYSLLFGIVVAVQAYNLLNPAVCNPKKGVRTGLAGAGLGFFVGVCPACIGIVGLILPLGVSLTLTYYSWIFMLFAIGVLVISLYLLGGFKK